MCGHTHGLKVSDLLKVIEALSGLAAVGTQTVVSYWSERGRLYWSPLCRVAHNIFDMYNKLFYDNGTANMQVNLIYDPIWLPPC